MDKARVEAFSDGVFSIAITLLVLSLQIPDLKNPSDVSLRHALFASIPQLVPYITSFATIGIIWLNHHALFQPVSKVDHTSLTLNLVLLFVVAFIPFPTALLSRYGSLPSTAFLYGITLTFLGLSYSLLTHHIARHCINDDARTNLSSSRGSLVRNLLGSVTYPLATVLSLWHPRISVAIYCLLAMYYFFPAPSSKLDLKDSGEPSG